MRTIHDAIDKVKDTLEEKGIKYGMTYRKVGVALNQPSQYTILVRMFEKLFRVQHLLNVARMDELSVEFLDIACYAILAMFESDEETNGQTP